MQVKVVRIIPTWSITILSGAAQARVAKIGSGTRVLLHMFVIASRPVPPRVGGRVETSAVA
jgi:hypothetical protein